MLKKFFSKHDIYLSGLLVALLLLGLFTLYSTTSGTGAENESYFIKQTVYASIGIFFYVIISFARLDWLKEKWFQILMYVVLVILLVAVLLFTAKVKGASRWFVMPIPFFGSINIQPADIAKLIVIINGAFILTQWKKLSIRFKSSILKNELTPYLLFLLPILVLILIQPALGTTIIVSLCLLFMFYFSRKTKNQILGYFAVFFIVLFFWIFLKDQRISVKLIISFIVSFLSIILLFKKSSKVILTLVFVFSSLFVFMIGRPESINLLGEYQKDRVDCWILPEKDPTGKCFQQIQAKIAIGSGELFGRGFSQGLQVQRQSLPEFQNDFIYAAFAEQYGFIGTLVILAMFFLFISEIFRLSTYQKSEFSRIVILGIGMMFLLQVFINISMNNGLLPTTGISLPFMSYGGSFMWISLVGVGIVQNLSHSKILSESEDAKYSKWDEDEYID
ncbi:MAG: rod shape-determining protein RodA [bacterium]